MAGVSVRVRGNCSHVWVMALDAGMVLAVECEGCHAAVGALVTHLPDGAHTVALRVLDYGRRGVSLDDVQALANWFAHQLGGPAALPVGGDRRRRRRKRPARSRAA